jgi:hypothetical protein
MPAYRVPPEWADFGACWGNDGLLYLAEWRRGFTVHELRALFFECQAARSLAQEVKNLTSTVEALSDQLDQAESRAGWYRSQLCLESRAGAMLARIFNG